jgi:hypothetical protein
MTARLATTFTRSGDTSKRPTVATCDPPRSTVSWRANVVIAAAT